MDYNPLENNNNDNITPDFTPDEYYKNNFADPQNSAENYAKYGEVFYSGEKEAQKDEPLETETVSEPVNSSNAQTTNENSYSNPYVSSSSSTFYGNTSYNSNTGSNNAYNPYNYQVNPVKSKKASKPITQKTLAIVVVVCILFSCIFGAVAGYLVGKNKIIETDGGLVITKSDSTSSSYKASNATLSTAEIVEKSADSVVEITTESVVTSAFSQQYIQEGAGSGVIISTDGYIVTNYHVIEGSTHITITLRDGTVYDDTEVIGTYEEGDIALLKINTDTELTAVTFGNSDNLKVGDYAVAIGNPLGQLGGTVTDGIISALDREVTIDDETMNLLQTNAEISPGNSGGGLFNGNGELIGIVNAKSSTEEAEGLGFAIPINDVQDILGDLKKFGYVKGQIDLGMSLSNISNTASAWMYGVNTTGVYVTSVNYNSNAAEAGFRAGDIIYEINGQEVTSTTEVNQIIDTCKVGDSVKFSVYRSGQRGTIEMVLEEYTPNSGLATNYENSGYNIYNY